MKKYFKHTITITALTLFIALALGSETTSSSSGKSTGIPAGPYDTVDLRATGGDMPDETIDAVYNNMAENLKEGLRIALIPMYPSPELDKASADYFTEQLYIRFINSSRYKMTDRADIDKAVAEQKFQTEYVNNDNAVQIGKLLGAEAVVIGTLEGRGGNRRVIMRALDVNTGRILTMFMEQVLPKEGYSEIYIVAKGNWREFQLMGNKMRTEKIRLEKDQEAVFSVPNGRWVVYSGKPRFTVESLNDSRLFLTGDRGKDGDTYTETKRESLAGASRNTGNRAANAQEAAQKLSKELEGKVRARAGTAFFPLTVRGISADDGNFIFDAMSMELANNGGLNIIEKQKLLALLNEYDFQMSGVVGYRTIGQLLGADVVIFGIGKGNGFELAAVEVASFKMLAQVSHTF
jgi:hypothetical protein